MRVKHYTEITRLPSPGGNHWAEKVSTHRSALSDGEHGKRYPAKEKKRQSIASAFSILVAD